MKGLQCHWSFAEDTLEHLQVHFKIFCSWCFYSKIDVKVKFLTFVFISGLIWKGHKWVRRSKLILEVSINRILETCVKTGNVLPRAWQEQIRCSFWGPKDKKSYMGWDTPSFTQHLVNIGVGVSTDYKSLNIIKLSELVQELFHFK